MKYEDDPNGPVTDEELSDCLNNERICRELSDTPCSKIILAGKLCQHFKWNNDAIPEVAKMIEIIENHTIRSMAAMTNDIVNNQKELPSEFSKLIEENFEDLLL